MRRLLAVALAAFALTLGGSARAAVILEIEVQDGSVLVGGTTEVDVLIRNVGDTAADLASFGYEFIVSPSDPMNANNLQFLVPDGFYGETNPPYVFLGNSLNEDLGFPAGAVSSTGGGINDRFVGGDATADFTDVVLPAGSSNFLLVRLRLTAEFSQAGEGEQFTISLIVDSPDTFFVDSLGDPTAEQVTAFDGVITVTNIPEPGTMALAALGLPLAGVVLRRSRLAAGPLA